MGNFISRLKQTLLGYQNNQSVDKKFFRAMLEYIGMGGIIPLPDNPASYIQNGYNKNIAIRSIISYITQKSADIPWQLCTTNTEGETETIENHPLLALMEQPNALQDVTEFKEQALGYLLLTGNCYIYKISPKNGVNKGKAKELYVLPSQYIEILKGNNPNQPIKGYQYSETLTGYNQYFEPDEIIHIKLPSYDADNGQSLYGISPLKSGLNTLNTSNSTAEALAKQSQNMGAIGILMHDDPNKSLTETQVRSIESKVHRKISGKENRGKVAFSAANFKWQQLASNSRDLQLLDTNKLTLNELCMLYHVSSLIFNNNDASTYNNLQTVVKTAYTDSILPYTNRIVSEINRRVVYAYDEKIYFKLDTSGIDALQKDKAEMVKWMKDAWWMSTKEKQQKLGVNVDESLPQYLVPQNLVDFSDSIEDVIDNSQKRYNEYG